VNNSISNLSTVMLLDGYKVGHIRQYPDDTTLVYSNLTARSSRTSENHVVAFGWQYFVEEYLIRQFQANFFDQPKDEILRHYQRRMDQYLGPGVNIDHIAALHDLGYLPLCIKALPEGTRVPLRVPMLTIYNTLPEFYWLTNMLETLMSNILWGAVTSATTAFQYRRTFEHYAAITGADEDFVPLQGHDFSFRGLTGVENAVVSGAAHLLSFTGTDTVPAIDFLETYYKAAGEQPIGLSVNATEHSVMCAGEEENERETIRRLLQDVYPSGILSIVSDTWNLWSVLTDYIPSLKEEILARDGKVVIRPDSGDPLRIICGDPDANTDFVKKGVIQLLWETFGGTVNKMGFKELDPHIGMIYGEAINPTRQEEILAVLAQHKFASSNVVFGIGSYAYNYVTRDTYGMAIKSTYVETESGGGTPIFKDPITDDGIKTSAFGLLVVRKDPDDGVLYCEEDVSWAQEAEGELRLVFQDGIAFNIETLNQIRARLASYL